MSGVMRDGRGGRVSESEEGGRGGRRRSFLGLDSETATLIYFFFLFKCRSPSSEMSVCAQLRVAFTRYSIFDIHILPHRSGGANRMQAYHNRDQGPG